MASTIQHCLACISVGTKPTKSFLVQPCNINSALNPVSHIFRSVFNTRELSLVAMKNPLHAIKLKKLQDWRVWCNHQESPQATIEILIASFFHAVNVNSRSDIEAYLTLDCVFDDIIFQVHSGRQGVADFICKLRDALGPSIRLSPDVDKVEDIGQDCWRATVTWHLDWVDVHTITNYEDGDRPFIKIPSTDFTNCFEIEKSPFDEKPLIRKIIGLEGSNQAAEFKKKLGVARTYLYKEIPELLQLELLRAGSAFYQHFPLEATGLLEKDDDNIDK